MTFSRLLLTGALLTGCSPGSCSSPESTAGQVAEKVENVVTHNGTFAIPGQVDDLEKVTAAKIRTGLSCEGTVLFGSQPGLFLEADIEDKRAVAVLKDELICRDDTELQIGTCLATIAQHDRGKMINGFTVTGLCVPTEFASDFRGRDFKDGIEIGYMLLRQDVFRR